MQELVRKIREGLSVSQKKHVENPECYGFPEVFFLYEHVIRAYMEYKSSCGCPCEQGRDENETMMIISLHYSSTNTYLLMMQGCEWSPSTAAAAF